jgi:transcriptional regulator with XRE-family HTH domain
MATTANHFGVALRGWRERMSPHEAGLDVCEGRRTRGLRREELAGLAGLSVDYVVRLEQGRASNPSGQVVTALARALRLAPAERDHLFRCAGLQPPGPEEILRTVPARVERLARRLGDGPLAIFAADWTLIGWNAMWTAAIGEPDDYGWAGRNLVEGVFGTPDGRRPAAIGAWPVRAEDGDEAEERALVADLRVAAAAYPGDKPLTRLVERLIVRKDRFARHWFSGTAGSIAGDRKVVEHPRVGDLSLDLEVLLVSGIDLRIVTYAAARRADARKLADLRAGLTSQAADPLVTPA